MYPGVDGQHHQAVCCLMLQADLEGLLQLQVQPQTLRVSPLFLRIKYI